MSQNFVLSVLIKFFWEKILHLLIRKKPATPSPSLIAAKSTNHLSQCFFRNQEHNNNLPTEVSLPLRVIDATASSITCSWLPDIPEIYNPPSDRKLAHWAVMFVDLPKDLPDGSHVGFDYTNVLKIESGDFQSKKLYYSTNSELNYKNWKNQKFVLFNPFYLWEIKSEPIILFNPNISWHTKYISPASLFQRKDNQLILLVNGESRNPGDPPCQKVGAFISPDPWNGRFLPLNDEKWVFKGPQGADSFQITSVIQEENTDFWIGYGNIRRGDRWNIGAVRFREDFSGIEYFEDLIVPPGNPKNLKGEYFPDIIKFNGQYRLMWCNLVSDILTERYISEAISENILGPFDPNRTGKSPVFPNASENDGIFRSSHTSQTTYFIRNETLFCIYDGTSRWKASGNRGNRMFGLARYDETNNEWTEDPRNPVFINPVYGTDIWGKEWKWCSDHLGGKPILWQSPQDDLILFFSGCYGTDSYRPGCARFKRKELV